MASPAAGRRRARRTRSWAGQCHLARICNQQHDFGDFEVAGDNFFWKIDYYDSVGEFGSEDPADPENGGHVGDGQHRLAAIALSGKSIETSVTFGMLPKAIIALDTGRRRSAADFQHIQHPNSDTGVWRRKQQMVKRAFILMAFEQNPDGECRIPPPPINFGM